MPWKSLRSILFVFVTALAGVRLLFAYIDPNTGGMVFQLLMVVFTLFTGILLFLSRYIRTAIARAKRLLRGSSAGSADSLYPDTLTTDQARHQEREDGSG